MSFVERHGLWSAEQFAAAKELDARLRTDEIDVVRFSFPDLHGLLRGKSLVSAEAAKALYEGVGVPSTLLLKDSAHRTVFPVFRAESAGDDTIDVRKLAGLTDVVLLADPTTFRVLPWAPNTGWVLCDVFHTDGQPVPYATRRLMQDTLGRLGSAGFDFVAGIELEFHIFKAAEPTPVTGGAPTAMLVNPGYQLLTELRLDGIEPLLDELRRNLQALQIALISMEVELGPSQFELTVGHDSGLAPADAMILLRSAVKQVCRRQGYHATFMCRPRIEQAISSGWHLHQSLRERQSGGNAMVPGTGETLSPTGRHYLAGLLEHASASTAFSTPTINGYRRYQPFSLAPDRAIWGVDNRGAMVRVVGRAEDSSTHLENRIGEPAANPYLYMASQILAGLDGITRKLDPGAPSDTPYDTDAPRLPRTLYQALDALRANACFADGFGRRFINYYTHIKDAELARFEQDVTDWEQREYFELF